MFRKGVSTNKYKVLKPFVFRGVQYAPSDKDGEGVFDPVTAQCVPHKLGALLRQRYLGDLGPSLIEALKEVAIPAVKPGPPIDPNSTADSDVPEGADPDPEDEQPEDEQPEDEPADEEGSDDEPENVTEPTPPQPRRRRRS